MKEKFRNLLTGIAVLAVGVAMGSSALLFETEEATASTTRTYAVVQPMDYTLASCADFTSAAYKGTVATSTNDDAATINFGDCNSGYYCTNSCDAYEMWNDDDNDDVWDPLETGRQFVRHNAVEIQTGGDTLRGPFGWLDNLPAHGDRATSVDDVASCYIRHCNGSECGGDTNKYTVDSDQSSRCSSCLGFCVASGDFS